MRVPAPPLLARLLCIIASARKDRGALGLVPITLTMRLASIQGPFSAVRARSAAILGKLRHLDDGRSCSPTLALKRSAKPSSRHFLTFLILATILQPSADNSDRLTAGGLGRGDTAPSHDRALQTTTRPPALWQHFHRHLLFFSAPPPNQLRRRAGLRPMPMKLSNGLHAVPSRPLNCAAILKWHLLANTTTMSAVPFATSGECAR